MKRLIYILTLLLAFGWSATALAVTDKEMEKARAIAAQAYLRYANDGSGYLDDIHPSSLADLEKSLKPKEKENIKAFKSIPVPKDFHSWDKQKLTDYWAGTAFSSKGLIEKGRQGKSRARKRINAMTVAAPQAEKAADKKEQPIATEQPKATADAAKPVAETPAEATEATALTAEPAPADSTAAQDPDAAALAALEEEEPLKKEDNHTWIYIAILVVLVAVVVALVVFASNVMKKSSGQPQPQASSPDVVPVPQTNPSAEISDLREKYSAKLMEKNNEVRQLNKKIEELNAQNASLKENLESLTQETASLRTRLTEATRKLAEAEQPAEQPAPAPQPHPAPAPQAVSQPKAPQTKVAQAMPLRTIYLGRANNRGIFVRADRSLNVGNSIFRLDTTDGYSGSFSVVDDPTVCEMTLLTPRESLAFACAVADIDATDGMTRIVNDVNGTAIFEGGCWKVIRKAKIHYE